MTALESKSLEGAAAQQHLQKDQPEQTQADGAAIEHSGATLIGGQRASSTGTQQGSAETRGTSLQGSPDEVTRDSERRRLNRLQATSDVLIAIGVVLVICYYASLPLIVLLVSMLLAFMLAPVVDLFTRLRLPRSLAALLAVLLLMGVLYGLFYLSYNRALAFAHDWPRYEGEVRKVLMRVRHTSEAIQKTAAGVLPPTSGAVRVQASSPLSWLFSANLGSITEVVLESLFIPFLVYFMLTWEEHVRSATVMLFRSEHRNTAYVTLGLISSMIRSFIGANVAVGFFMAAVSTVVFAVLQLPYFYFLGFVSGFLSLVPYLGVLLAMIPPLVVGLGRIDSTEFAVIVITVLALHLFAINVLYPKFLGSRLHLNPLGVTVALLFWSFMWGPMGLILAIPITAAMKIIFDHVERLRPFGKWLGE